MSKMRESKGGGFEDRPGEFYIRCTVAPQKRQAERAPWATTLGQAVERGRLVQSWVNRLRQADGGEFVEVVVERGAAAADAEALAKVAGRVDILVGGHFDRIESKPDAGKDTFRGVGERLTSGELARLHPDHVGQKKSLADDEYRLEILYDLTLASGRKLGDVRLADFSVDVADDAMGRLDDERRRRAAAKKQKEPRPLEPAARRQYAQLIHRVLKIAAYPLRLTKASPLPTGWLPRVPNNKAKGLLYPDEEATSMRATAYPLHWRVYFGFLARSGFRADEAAGLTIADVDVERGIITLDENKTDDPRAPSFGPEVMLALKAWKESHRAKAEPGDLFFMRPDGARIPIDGLADFYREEFLHGADVTRPELFERSKRRIPIRVHDLRGFFVTYALAHGKTETWVMDRTGHKSSTMVNRYRRVARTVAEARLGEPLPLHLAIPEFAAAFTAANAAAKPGRKGESRRRSSRPVTRNGSIAQSVELRTFNP
jgi:integrase